MATIKPVVPAAGARRRLRPTRKSVVEDPDAPLGWLARAAVSPTLVIDGRGTIRQVSRSATDLLGHGAADLIGQGIDQVVFPPDVGAILTLLRSAEYGSSEPVQTRIRHLDGNWLTVEAVGTRIHDASSRRHLVLTLHDVTKWKAIEEQLTQQAFHDPLTGLPNRALFVDRLEASLGRRRYHAMGAAVLFLDLDDFKIVNDSLGHVEGDNLLRQVATRLSEAIRPGDLAARFGGDEFALLLDDVDEDGAVRVATRAMAALNRPFELTEHTVRVGATVGVALSAATKADAVDMLRAADIAMYSAKASGKGRIRVFEPSMRHEAAERLRLGVDIRGAVERGEFVLHYQPTVHLPGGDVSGMEALLRWEHPELGLIPPSEFIPLAESTGLIIPLGEFVLREACRQARAWQRARAGQPPLMMSVNLSGIQLQDPGLVAAVSLALEHAELEPEFLTLEVTESVMAHETDNMVRRLRQLKGLGLHIAIDDFGTGYSSLAYLRRFPVDTVKIDKSFVDGIASGSAELALVRAVVRLARSLKMKTIAEGVEHESQARRLGRMGCNEAQGFFFARPMPPREATAYVVGHTTLSMWVGHSGHELQVIKEVVGDFEALHPTLRIDVVGGVSDARIMAARRGEAAPDVVCSVESDNFGSFSTAGGFVDLAPYMRRDGIEVDLLTDATQAYTRRNDRQWALPLLADTYGLYLNRGLLAEAGLARPPRTISELTDYARRLTRRNADGSLRVVGFNPMVGFYENSVAILGHMFGAAWATPGGGSDLAGDPGWVRMLEWQRSLIEWYGYEDLVRFGREVGPEFAPSNAFQTGQLALSLDGEWRVAFIESEAPHLDYAAAPLPADDRLPELYGSGYINGSVIGITADASSLDESWELVRYLALDDGALAKLSNGLRNVPSTKSSLTSPELVPDERFGVFLDIFAHARSASIPITVGSSTSELLTNLAAEWQAGQVVDLPARLGEIDERIGALQHKWVRAASHDRRSGDIDPVSLGALPD
jgi:diguanylate cyclase (GGDEF)-like protein/PAS domain S-box-containing protein